MSSMDRHRWIREQLARDRWAGKAANVVGDVFHVVPGGSATHFGYAKSVHRNVYTSLADAITACVSGRGDAIVLWPGAHTVSTASAAMSKDSVRIFGPEAWIGDSMRGMKSSASVTTDIAGDEIMNVTGADCGIYGVTIIPITAGVGIDLSAAANRFVMKDCYIDMATPVVNIATVGVKALGAASNVVIDGVTIESDGAQGNGIIVTALVNSRVQNCNIFNTAGTWASAVLCGAATTGVWFIDNNFDSYGTALTAGINGTGATIANGVKCLRNTFGSLVTVGIDNFDAAEAAITLNYDYGIGATDGGVLIVAIT